MGFECSALLIGTDSGYGRACKASAGKFESFLSHVTKLCASLYADVAKLVNATGLDPEIWGFESLRPYYASIAQQVEASGLNPVKCEFESHSAYLFI